LRPVIERIFPARLNFLNFRPPARLPRPPRFAVMRRSFEGTWVIARVLLHLGLVLAASGGAAGAQVAAPPLPAPVIAPPMQPPATLPSPTRRYPLLGPTSQVWPPVRMLTVRSSPDWSKASVYPAASRRNNEEGDVGMDLLVGPDGVPRACRIWLFSRYPGLDDSTCDLGMSMRLAPPEALSTYRVRLTWRLSDSTVFGAARLTIDLRLEAGRVSSCLLMRTGAVPREWSGFACRLAGAEIGHFLNGRQHRARDATIVVELIPAGAAAMPSGETGAPAARRWTEFQLNRRGDLSDCRLVRDQGFGPRTFEYSGPCGLFLSQTWLRPGSDRDSPRAGAIEISVWVVEGEDAPRP
jgi:hypothetical protein